MGLWQVETPIALIIFNRPDTTAQVLAEIAKVKPRKLFVIADGPRSEEPQDVERCSQVRALVDQLVTWECEISRNYADANLGCGYRPSTGLDWVFSHVEQAIILEDDCLPDPSFFRYCDELLERYKDDERVMMISGRNDVGGTDASYYSYSFRRVMSCWGWATWRRAWRHHSMSLDGWSELRQTDWLTSVLGNRAGVEHWRAIFDSVLRRGTELDFWDYQWAYACWLQNGYAIVPERNLVRNVGHRPDATHTQNPDSRWGRLKQEPLMFPLRHPPFFIPNRAGDDRFLELILATARRRRTLRTRLKSRVRALFYGTQRCLLAITARTG